MDWSNLKQDYERLGSFTAVAREYGVSKASVSQQAKKQGLTNATRSLDIDWSGLSALYDSGMTYQQLADHYGCSMHAIQNAVKRLGVKPRERGLPKGYEWTEERRAAHSAACNRPEFRAKSRENLLKRLPSMRGPSANSPLERLLQGALIKAGISFETQVLKLGRYCVDIELLQARVIIEADGALHYLRETEDAERDAALGEAGYRVFRFNGAQINRDPDGCIGKVAEACGLTPDTDPVAIIRNGMVGENNPNWGGGPRSLVCDECGTEFVEEIRNARKFGKKFCNSRCYGSWMLKHPEQSNRWLTIDWSDLPALYKSGMTMRDLADRFGCSVHAVSDAMKRMDVPARKPGRRLKSR